MEKIKDIHKIPLIPFSKIFKNEFLSRTEDNFEAFLEKLRLFFHKTRADVKDGTTSRRNIDYRFNYNEELRDVKINIYGISDEEVASEFNDILQGCIRHQDPTTAFNIIPPPLLASIAGITLTSIYNPNTCWDFISGKLCLYEKKITRMLGNLAGWSQADGFVITGGKQALTYAIKNGIGRANTNYTAQMNDYVVICSELAHYSIEHVCHKLGISPENCIRVSANPSGEMDIAALKKTLLDVISQCKRIAAVIAVAGGTIDLIPDDILSIKSTIDSVTKQKELDYVPYLHVDSVITWTWLAFENNPTFFSGSQISPDVTRKIQHVTSKLVGISYADSFAADFHKTGFCPYAAGVFIVRDSKDLAGITPDEYIPKEDPYFGEVEPFRQTFENSRSGLSIVSIWIALRKMGLEGLRKFVLYQLEVCELFKQKIEKNYNDHFEVLNDRSLGWEIVLKPHFRKKMLWSQLQKTSSLNHLTYINDCHALLHDLWYRPLDDEAHCRPVIGFVRQYSKKGVRDKAFPAFLIHPTSPHYDENAIDEMIKSIIDAKVAFDNKCTDLKSSNLEDYLCEMVPPR